MKNEKKPTKKKNSNEESLKKEASRAERILEETIELPSHIALMRGLFKSKNGSKKQKHRRSSQKRKR